MMRCAWASIDERWKASGGRAGDQTGNEFKIGNWYSFGQNCILRPKKKEVAEVIAAAMKHFALSSYVGYDQMERTTLYDAMEFCGWDYTKLNHNVETDCSAAVAVAVRCAGIRVSKHIYTGNMRQALLETEEFECLTGSRYLMNSNCIRKGDIILNERSHVIVAIENGKKANLKNYEGDLPTDTVNKNYGTKDNIKRWQKFLCWYGTDVDIDGSFGPDTTAKTKTFQKDNGLTADGSAGPKTLARAKTYRK